MSTITPTIGRKVWFWPNNDDHSVYFIDREQALDATVIYVYLDGTVNLLIVDHVGGVSARRRVPLHQGDVDSRPKDHACATWMPYQREQAKKADTAAVTAEKKAEVLKPFERHYDANMLSSPAMIKELIARGYGVTNDPLDTPDPCLAKRKPGEPMFTLLGRDPMAASLVWLWSEARRAYMLKSTARERIMDAKRIAGDMSLWHDSKTGRRTADVLDYLPFGMLADALCRRGATVTTAPHGGDGEPLPAPAMTHMGNFGHGVKPAGEKPDGLDTIGIFAAHSHAGLDTNGPTRAPDAEQQTNSLRHEIERAINRHNAENGSNTPDFVLSEFLMHCLEAYNNAVRRRDGVRGSTVGAGFDPFGPSI